MGLATIDSHSQREHTEIHKISKFGVNQASFHIQQFKKVKIYKEMYGIRTPCRTALFSLVAIHFFVNFDIFKWLYLAYVSVYLHQTWGFCKASSALYDYVDQ